MTIPGVTTDPDPDPKPNELDAADPHHESDDDDPIVAVEKNAKGESLAPVAEVIRYRKESKAAKKENDALKAEVEQLRGLKQTVEQWTPVMQHLAKHPGLLRGEKTTAEPQRDTEAEQFAEDMGFIAADGGLDVGRARRVIDRLDQRNGRMVDQRVAPLAQTTAGQIADVHRMRAKAARASDNQTPFATEESIDEVYDMLPPELLANQNVAAILPLMAAGIDKAKGRTPKAPEPRVYGEPWFSEHAGTGGRAASVLSTEDKQFAKSRGIDDKKWEADLTQLQTNGRRGVALE